MCMLCGDSLTWGVGSQAEGKEEGLEGKGWRGRDGGEGWGAGFGGTLLRQPGALELVLLIMMDELLNTSVPQFL